MGKGDKKTKRGKIIMGSYGKKRPRNVAKENIVSVDKSQKTKKIDENKLVKKTEVVAVEKVELKEKKVIVETNAKEEIKETIKKPTVKKIDSKKPTVVKKEEKPKTKPKKSLDKKD